MRGAGAGEGLLGPAVNPRACMMLLGHPAVGASVLGLSGRVTVDDSSSLPDWSVRSGEYPANRTQNTNITVKKRRSE